MWFNLPESQWRKGPVLQDSPRVIAVERILAFYQHLVSARDSPDWKRVILTIVIIVIINYILPTMLNGLPGNRHRYTKKTKQ